MSKPRLSVRALLVAALCAGCGGGSGLKSDGSAGAGGTDAGAAGTGAGAAGQSGAAGAHADASDTTTAIHDAAATIDDAADGAEDSIARSDGTDRANDASDARVEAPLRLAANGVPIPPPALAKNDCAELRVQSVACSLNDECAPVSCDCGGSPLVFDQCISGSCLAGISCSAACATQSDVVSSVFGCLTNGVCKSASDCPQAADGEACLVPPNAAIGECVTRDANSPCLADADCRSLECVVTADGVGLCSPRNELCNTDAHCAPGSHCALAPGAFTGQCTNGMNGSLCLTPSDCKPSLECTVISQGQSAECTSRGVGAPCLVGTDCKSGDFCVNGTCDAGAVGDPCSSKSQCHVPLFCSVSIQSCSQGALGDLCVTDSECQGFCAGGTCSDGKSGSPCRGDHSGCVAGLHCPSTGPLICVGP
ncbi:MAG TPA: hypothetical protein VK989_04330 [Polyangia bacterium]|nr:hypothetical protein [Polyangia bacterium]